MTFASAFAAVIGGLLLIGSLGLSIHVTVSGKKVKTWTPFVWSGLLGVLIVVSEVVTAGDPVSRSLAHWTRSIRIARRWAAAC